MRMLFIVLHQTCINIPKVWLENLLIKFLLHSEGNSSWKLVSITLTRLHREGFGEGQNVTFTF